MLKYVSQLVTLGSNFVRLEALFDGFSGYVIPDLKFSKSILMTSSYKSSIGRCADRVPFNFDL